MLCIKLKDTILNTRDIPKRILHLLLYTAELYKLTLFIWYLDWLLQDMSMTGANIVESIALAASATSANGIGRVYTATSLPSHIWSFNGTV